MTPRAPLALRLAVVICGLAALTRFDVARAQSVNAQPASAAGQSSVQGPASVSSTEYRDHFIDGGSLKPDITTGDNATNDTQGLAHSLQIDGVASVLSSHAGGNNDNVVENGILLRSQWETAQYGAWSLDAAARTGGSGRLESEQGQGGVITLRQRDMPFDGEWHADNALGDVNSPDINLARLQPRFYLPTGPLQGLTTEWRGPSGLQIVGGGGVPGVYDGIEVPNFRTLDGSTATAGMQWSPAAAWTVGGQVIQAHDVNLAIGPVIGRNLVDVIHDRPTDRCLGRRRQARANESARRRCQRQVEQHRHLDRWITGARPVLAKCRCLSHRPQHDLGQSADFERRARRLLPPELPEPSMAGRCRHRRSSFRFRPRYQHHIPHRRCTLPAVARLGCRRRREQQPQRRRHELVARRVRRSFQRRGHGPRAGGLHLHADGQGFHLHPQRNLVDAGRYASQHLDLHRAHQRRHHQRPRAGQHHFECRRLWRRSIHESTRSRRQRQLGASHSGARRARHIRQRIAHLAVVAGMANPGHVLRQSRRFLDAADGGVPVDSTNCDARAGHSRTRSISHDPLPARIGSHFAPLGGAPGSGSGEISGTVFLDANNNGHADAGEVGAPNVTVVLDGRFSVQTDANGRFDFPVVATGHHIVSVIADNLPLPWLLINEGRMELDVRTRDRTEINLAAQRPR